MKVESSGADVYHTTDYKNWEKVDDVEYDDGVVRFQYQKGKHKFHFLRGKTFKKRVDKRTLF